MWQNSIIREKHCETLLDLSTTSSPFITGSKAHSDVIHGHAPYLSFVESTQKNISSPLPSPVVFFKELSFSTKKERNVRKERPPPAPKPRCDSSKIYSNRFSHRPLSVSFVDGETPLSSKYYNENLNELYLNQCFNVISKIGSGSFGEVFKVRSKEDGEYYAIKKCKEEFYGPGDRLRKIEEVRKHELLPVHRNCVRFYKAWEERNNLYIQMELCEMSLSQYAEENHEIPESLVWNCLIDLLLAIKHLHDHNLIHLDIKPENMFVSKEGICKLGDFGLVVDVSKTGTVDPVEGDSKYVAPELMQGIFTKAADVFSLGITILELASDLDLPQGNVPWHQLRQRQIPVQFLENLSSELINVIRNMMEPDHEKRPTVDHVFEMEAVRHMHEKRQLELQTKAVSPIHNNSYEWGSSFSDEEVFESQRNSFNGSLGNIVTHLDFDKMDDSLSFGESIHPFKTFDCLTNNGSILSESERKKFTEMLSPCMSSSPKLSKKCRSVRVKKDVNESVPSLKPQNLMHIFDEQSSDDSV